MCSAILLFSGSNIPSDAEGHIWETTDLTKEEKKIQFLIFWKSFPLGIIYWGYSLHMLVLCCGLKVYCWWGQSWCMDIERWRRASGIPVSMLVKRGRGTSRGPSLHWWTMRNGAWITWRLHATAFGWPIS